MATPPADPAPRRPVPVARRVLLFLALFAALQAGWQAARGTVVERAVIDFATVGGAVALIGLVTPGIDGVAVGPRIRAPGGGLNILNGCEGVEVLFLLIAALCVFPARAGVRLAGFAAALVFVFAINQLRILALFYAYRSDRALFALLHGTVAPVALVALALLFFLVWMKVGAGRTASIDAARG